MKVRLQIAGVLVGVASLAALWIWGAFQFKSFGWLALCIPAFALTMA